MMAKKPISWTNETRKLGDLKPWDRNPRQMTVDQAKRLDESYSEFGHVQTIAIDPDNEVLDGHQRLNVLLAKHGRDHEVEVRVSSRELTEKEREKLTVFVNMTARGEPDWDELANWDLEDLIDWGLDEDLLLGSNYTNPKLTEETQTLPRAREMARVLISIPVDQAAEVKSILDSITTIQGVEVDYGAN